MEAFMPNPQQTQTPPTPNDANAMPQGAEQENNPPIQEDPREALNMKKAEIKLLEQELSDIDAKLDAEFIDNIDKLLTPEELESRFDDDVRNFLSLVEEKRPWILAAIQTIEEGLFGPHV
jgi:hypothetical protein